LGLAIRPDWLGQTDSHAGLRRFSRALLLDYTLYLQHLLHHRVPLLWRFHAVHHVDLDLDTTTALRFHSAKIAVSLPFRAAQVLLIGVNPESLITWQSFLLFSIMFHHSNVRLAKSLEDRLAHFELSSSHLRFRFVAAIPVSAGLAIVAQSFRS
jgi:sterol desaturase/sphingolipid hydroxylase (fatty acid hydroxylase superfamily)